MNLCPYCLQEVTCIMDIDVCKECERVVEGETITSPPKDDFDRPQKVAGAFTKGDV